MEGRKTFRMGRRNGKRKDLAGEEGWQGCADWNENLVLRELASSKGWERQGRRETERQRIPVSSQMLRLLKFTYTWLCLYLPRIIQNPTDVLQTLYPPRVPKTISPIPS